MSKFTQGPWRLERPSKKSRDYVVWNKVGNIVINTGSCNDSNARLIAEAPAMYALLKKYQALTNANWNDAEVYHPTLDDVNAINSLMARVDGK